MDDTAHDQAARGAPGPATAAGSASGPEGDAEPEDGEAGEPAGWLLIVETDRPGEGEGKAPRGAAALESLADADLLRALRNTGLPVRISTLSQRGPVADLRPAWSPGAGPAEVLIVFARELATVERLEQLCQRARQLAGAHAGVLACLLPEQPPLPALLLQAADRLRRAGADDVLLGLPAAVELLDRARALSRVRRQLRAGEKAQLQLRSLTQALQLLGPEAPGPDRAAAAACGPREENAPEPVPTETSVDPSESARAFQRFIDQIRAVIGCAHVALVLLGDDTDGLTVVTASSEPHDTCFPGPRLAYAQLRAALADGHLREVIEGKERQALTRIVSSGASTLAPWVMPLPLHPGGGGTGWALVLYEARPAAAPSGAMTGALGAAGELVASFAQLLALAVRSRHLDESLRERTRRVRITHLTPPPQKRPLLQYREFFESSADGVIVLDAAARIVWLNRAAEQMTGYATAGLAGHLLCEVVPAMHRDTVFRTVEQVLAGGPVKVFDLALTSTSSETLSLSVSTSPLLAEERYVVLSFRDVTEKRILENELRKTKEFLERLIDSTVDGIIAADIQGKIVLFNQGAARITGYSPDEVIGKLPVWALYPDKEAQRIMAQLRSDEHGGKGRLLQSRRTILGKNRVIIPVALTASIIYEEGREVATVGILSDLRERLRIEQRLLQTEERLAASERQALIVELAGTAAHELNQPLTSVMGYAELLRRRLPEGFGDIHSFADILVKEAERMADIVRKIGRITRYETKTYVGESRILDLDKSARPDSLPELEELPSLLPSTEPAADSLGDAALLPLFSGVAAAPPKPGR